MKWSGWIVFAFAALGAIGVDAAEPQSASPRLKRVPVTPVRFAADERSEAPPAAVTPHTPVHYRLATWNVWSGTATGYVYSPGACDYTPPCVDHLWDGYEQKPHRCYPIHMHGGCRGMHGCGGCDSCGKEASCGCGGHASLLKRAHGWHFGSRCSSCGSIAPSCAAPTCAAPSCGYEASSGKGSHDSPLPVDGPPVPMPEVGGNGSTVVPFPPLPEKAARGHRLRGFTWPESSLQR